MLTIYPWQKNAWQHLLSMQKNQRLPHALLFHGPPGIGLTHVAATFAMQTLCPVSDAGTACGQCHHCKLCLSSNHPDLFMLAPEESGKQIKIAQVRALIDYVSLKSFSESLKIVIIKPAEAMNRATANALLKTLEEPPAQSMFLLLTHKPSLLPVTIRSRCQRIDFKPAYSQATIDWLAQKVPAATDINLLLHLAHGGPFKALALVDNNQLQQRQQLLQDLAGLNKADIVETASRWQSNGCEQVLLALLHLVQDLIKLKLTPAALLLNFDIQKDLQAVAEKVELNQLIHYYSFIQKNYQDLLSTVNFNPLNIIEAVLIQWLNPDVNLSGR